MEQDLQSLLEPVHEFLQVTLNSPLAAIADTFLQIVPEALHFQVALNVLLPGMSDAGAKEASRIQSTFLLWYIYRKHSLGMNPFQSTFREALDVELDSHPGAKPGALESTLDLILSGNATELEPYSPESLVAHWPQQVGKPSSRLLFSHGVPSSSSEKANGSGATEEEQAYRLLILASETSLSLQEQKTLLKVLSSATLPIPNRDDGGLPFPLGRLRRITENNSASVICPLLSRLLSQSSDETRRVCWDTLQGLPPSLQSFDVWVRLIKDQTPLAASPTTTGNTQYTEPPNTVGYLARSECLVSFATHCDERLAEMETEDNRDDDPGGRYAMAVQHYTKFCVLLLRMGEGPDGVDWESEVSEDTWFAFLTQLQSFALRNARYEAPSELYKMTARLFQRHQEMAR